jgi:hypothetical protein
LQEPGAVLREEGQQTRTRRSCAAREVEQDPESGTFELGGKLASRQDVIVKQLFKHFCRE